MQLLQRFRKSNTLKSFQLAHNLKNIELRYSPRDSLNEDGISIRIKRIEWSCININLSTDINIDSLEINRNSCSCTSSSNIFKLFDLFISFIAYET